jgi:hypothetical protein
VSAIVVIGPAEALTALRQLFDAGLALESFTDAESVAAVEHILAHKPRIVVLESDFAASGRGEALVTRIKSDPHLSDCEVRIVSRDGTGARGHRKKSGAGIKVAGAGHAPFDARGTRRATRVRMAGDAAVAVDGNPAVLVDLSPLGAQVLSRVILRPNQKIRLALTEGKDATIRCVGAVAWAAFEMPSGLPPRYRAGVRFSSADPEALTAYAERHRASGSHSEPNH